MNELELDFDTTKPTIFLDLDETIINSVESKKFKKEYKDKAVNFDFENMDDYYVVFERPYLQYFLDYLFANFNVCIWTAASKDYALFIISEIVLKKPERKISLMLFSLHGDMSEKKKKGTKDLSLLWDEFNIQNLNNSNTLILDDLSDVHKTNPNNHIVAPPFRFKNEHSENDRFLIDVIPSLNSCIKHVKNKNTNPIGQSK